MPRPLQLTALLIPAVAVISCSPIGPDVQWSDFSFDLQTRHRAVYSVRLVNPPEGGTAMVHFSLTSGHSPKTSSDTDPRILMAIGDRLPTASQVEEARLLTADATDAGPLGRVLVHRHAPFNDSDLEFEQGASPSFITFFRDGDAPDFVFARLNWSGKPYAGDLLFEDVTGELR